MKKEIIISEANDLAVVLEDGRAVEFFLRSGDQLVADIIWGQVESVVPGIEAAFVNIGQDKNGFIHVSDLPSAQTPRKNQAPKKPTIKARERLLVQIAKAPTGTKGARLTGRITIPGRFLVLVPHDNRVSISRRITNERERERLRKLTLRLKDPGHGLIVRTEAIGRSEDDLKQDILELIDIWADILHQVQIVAPPALLHRDSDLIHRVLRDVATSDVARVVLDSKFGAEKARDILAGWMPELAQHVVLHRGPHSILDQYRITQELEAAISPKVWLPSGGYLIIEHTEALTVIDVNSGRMTQTKSLADTVLRVNLEAAAEVARQLRLRDIGGIIVIDFISMDADADRRKVLQAFQEALKADKSRPQMTNFSEHGLIEVSRRRQGQNLAEQLTTPCENCHGSGRLPHSHLLKGGAPVPPALAETSAIVHEIAVEPLATEPVRATRAPQRGPKPAAAEAEFAIEDFEVEEDEAFETEEAGEGAEAGDGRKRRRRRRRGRGRGRAEGEGELMGGTLTSTLPEGMSAEDEDRTGFLPPVALPEEVRAPRGRGRGERREAAPVEAVAEAAPVTGPSVEEISLDDLFGGAEPVLQGRDQAPRGRGERSGRGERGERGGRERGGRDRDRAPRGERFDRFEARPEAAAPAAAGESRFSRRVERRPEGAPAPVAPVVAKAAPVTAPAAPVAPPKPVAAPVAAAPAPAPVPAKPAPAPKAAAKPKAAPKPLAVPEALETTTVPGVFVLKKKAPAAAATPAAPVAEVPAEAPAKKAAAPRKRATAAKAEAAPVAAEAEAPKKAAPRKRATTAKAAAEPAPEAAEATEKPKRAPRKKAAPVEA